MKLPEMLDILSVCGTAAVIVNKDGIIHMHNRLASRLLDGAEERSLSGLSLSDIAPRLLEEAPEGESPQYVTVSFRKYLAAFPAPEIPGIPEDMRLITFRDATAEVLQKICEEALEHVTDSVTITDTSCRVLFMNTTAIRMDELEKDSVIGESLYSLYQSLDGQGLYIPRVLRTGQACLDYRQYYKTKNMKNVDVTASTYPLVCGGRLLGGCSIMKDWSTVDSLNKKIVELQDKLLHQKGQDKGSRKSVLTARYRFDDIIHISSVMEDLLKKCRQAARSDSSVMFYGETGTGKELFAQSIHNASRRASGPFIAINCAAIPENLLEGLLFGTEKGAFTGAEKRPGLFEQASGGTLLLDELNSMNMSLQAKLLRVLQESRVRRVGGSEEIPVDVRVISNLNIPPMKAIEENKLRIDLFYRLGVVNFLIPPLRERPEDIPLLVNRFIMRCSAKLSRKVQEPDRQVLSLFSRYQWPGNVRELEHVIEHAMNVLPEGENVIRISDLPQFLQTSAAKASLPDDTPQSVPSGDSLLSTMQSTERSAICRVLRKNNGNISRSALELNLSRQSLQYRIRKYGIRVDEL